MFNWLKNITRTGVAPPQEVHSNTIRQVLKNTGFELDTLIYPGGTMSRDKAAAMSAVHRCVSLISGSGADQITDSVRVVDRTTHRAVKNNQQANDALSLLKESPDGIMPAHTFIEDALTDLLMSGNCVIVKKQSAVNYNRTKLQLADPMTAYGYLYNDGKEVLRLIVDSNTTASPEDFDPRDVIIARWPRMTHRTSRTSSGRARWFSEPPIQTIGSAIALALGAEKWASAIFNRKSGALGNDYAIIFDSNLSAEMEEKLFEMLLVMGQGRMPLVLGAGAKIDKLTPTPQDADLLRLRQFQISEIARTFGVPSVMIGDTDAGNTWGSSILELEKGFNRYSLRLHVNRFLEALSRSLLKPGLKFEVDSSRILRGDAAAISQLISAGGPKNGVAVFSKGELRSLLGIDDDYTSDWFVEDGLRDQLKQPSNNDDDDTDI